MVDIEHTSAAVTLCNRAEKLGWSVSITTRTGDWQEKPVISTVARFAHSDGRRAVAQWLNGRAESAYAWRAGFVIDPIQAKRSFRDLGKELKDA